MGGSGADVYGGCCGLDKRGGTLSGMMYEGLVGDERWAMGDECRKGYFILTSASTFTLNKQ